MSRLPAVTGAEVVRALERAGFAVTRQRGSHVFLKHPAVSFGAPSIAGAGVATWVVKEQYEAGESVGAIAEDFALSWRQIEAALAFEGVTPAESRAA